MQEFFDKHHGKFSEKYDTFQRSLDKNKHGVFSAKVGAASTAVAGTSVVIGYLAKPEDFLNFISNHVAAATSIGIVVIAVIAALMYFSYQHSKKKWADSEDLSYYLSSESKPDNHGHHTPEAGAPLTPTDSSINRQSSFTEDYIQYNANTPY